MPASKKEAKEFVKRWKKRLSAIPAGSNNEQQDTQKFWVDLLINVLGIPVQHHRQLRRLRAEGERPSH